MRVQRIVRGAAALFVVIVAVWGPMPALAQGTDPARAADAAGGGGVDTSGRGLVVQAYPWRTADRRVVKVDYTVRLEGIKPAPGTLLAAYRQTRLGRSEGPPLAPVGYLTVISSEGAVAIARAVPGQPAAGPHFRNPVVQVGDVVRVERSLRGLGEAVSSVDLAKLFPAGDAAPAKDFAKLVGDLVKPAGGPGQVVLVFYTGAGPEGAASEQTAALVGQTASALSIDADEVYTVTLPAGGGSARVELRKVVAESGSKRNRAGAP